MKHRAPSAAVTLLAALALVLGGCRSSDSTSPPAGASSTAPAPTATASASASTSTSASPVSSAQSRECVFGGPVSDCTSADPTVEKDLYSTGDCSFVTNTIAIDWGDKTPVQNVTDTGPSAANTPKFVAQHTYKTHGVYTISITGSSTSPNCPLDATTYTFTFGDTAPAGQVSCTQQDPSTCLLASNAVAGLDVGNLGDAPPGMTVGPSETEQDGYAGAEFSDGHGDVIIANEDADLVSPLATTTPTPYQSSSFLAEVQIYHGVSPAALRTAVQFAQQVASTGHPARIYVTGLGLGGAEAQAQAQALGSLVTGGVTFGAPGLPAHQVTGSESTITNFVDYGDPVGNWATDPQSELADLASENTDHFGGVDLVGNPVTAALPRLAANTHKLEISPAIKKLTNGLPDNDLVDKILHIALSTKKANEASVAIHLYDESLKLATFAYLGGAALLYHSISQYAQDLGVSLAAPVAAPTAMAPLYREYDPAASRAVLQQAASTMVSADGTVSAPSYQLTASASTGDLDTQKFGAQGDSQYDVTYDPANQISSMSVNDPSGTSYVISNDDAGQEAWSSRVYYYGGPDETGTLTGVLYNWHSGGSQLQLFTGLPKGITKQTRDYSQPDGTGHLISETSS